MPTIFDIAEAYALPPIPKIGNRRVQGALSGIAHRTEEAALRTAEMFRARADECMKLADTIRNGDKQVLEQIAQAWLFLADRVPPNQIAPRLPANENVIH